MQMVNMHGVQLTPPEEMLAQVNRLLEETEGKPGMERLRLHLMGRRETLSKQIEGEAAECTGSKNTEKNTA